MGNTNTVQRWKETQNHQETQDQEDDQRLPTNPNRSEEPQEIEEESPTTFKCEICIEPMSSSNNQFKNQNKCVHPFCTDCMAKYIKVKVEDDAAADVECPGLNCKQILDPLSCKPLIEHQLFVKWCDNLCESALNGLDRCYCPYRNCSSLVVNECGDNLKGSSSKCPNCKKMFCFHCKLPWHAGYRCDESDQLRDRNDVLFGQLLERRNWTRCPGCGQPVDRSHGCTIISCRCKTSFCYNCGTKADLLHSCPKCQPTTTMRGLCRRTLFVIYAFLVSCVFLGLVLGFIFLLYVVGREM